jgi:hypothetical protein
VYLIGFCGPHLRLDLISPRIMLKTAFLLGVLWFAVEQVAMFFEIWTYPLGGTLPIRVLSLPIEEYLVFFLHTLTCFALLLRETAREDE